MGCAASKGAATASPAYEVSSSSYNVSGSPSAVALSAELVLAPGLASIWSRPVRLEALELGGDEDGESGECAGKVAATGPGARGNSSSGTRLGNLYRCIEGEQVAAGWPAWLSAVAAEAVQGWVPLKAENFEKLGKIGQGTYSSVFQARNLETGRLVALKKVRFDSVEPESVRFMAREIQILRRLQRHPNVVGLEGLITSRSSCNIYLVFEYVDHDLAGLTSAPDVTFSEPQIKCYMRQLLLGLEHCHARGVMHRDIKCANLLVSNDGELKVADFGLANLFSPAAQPLTSRVVTLWYRPPELLLGATAYEPSVDLWSAGCVFAEMYARRPILQGRTEVEQIHKIFKLCGSPPDDYWRGASMSHAAVFRPQHPYESRLRDTFRSMPDTTFHLLSTLLSVEPAARGTASSALVSEYFRTQPYACEPSSLPKYAPNKEMDAKFREDSRRRNNSRSHGGGEAAKRLSKAHKSLQDTSAANQRHGHVHAEESLPRADGAARKDGGEASMFVDLQPAPVISKRHDTDAQPCARQMSRSYQEAPRFAEHLPLSGPVQLTASTGFAWAKKPRPDAAKTTATTKRSCSKGSRTNNNGSDPARTTTTATSYEVEKQEMIKQWAQVAEAFSTSEAYNNRFITEPVDVKQLKSGKKHKAKGERVEFSGPLLSQSWHVDELLQKHEQQIRRAGRRSWFHKGDHTILPLLMHTGGNFLKLPWLILIANAFFLTGSKREQH
uniref:[RNA-polymerase]-subunit kinase n=1 Tax=Phyllostachys edulis TaxID=38705 RepID=A0AA96NLI5_PHYED|nr:CKL13 protein [Phyllostachys edulis]